jgi:hypothetical protein
MPNRQWLKCPTLYCCLRPPCLSWKLQRPWDWPSILHWQWHRSFPSRQIGLDICFHSERPLILECY